MSRIHAWILLMCLTKVMDIRCNAEIAINREKRSGSHDSEEKSHGDGTGEEIENTGHEDGNENGDNEPYHHGDHTSIINSLFTKYDPSASPTHGSDEPTIIAVNVQLLSMDEISDSKMEYVIDTRMTFSWSDKRLTSHDCKEEGLECDDHFDMKRQADKMWFPDLYILNARTAINHEQPLKNGMVYLKGSGDVMLSKRLTMTLRCPMDLSLYPMDTQKCPIIICPYSLTEAELQLAWTHEGVGLLEDFQRGHSKFELIPPVRTGQMKWKYNGPDVSGLFSCVNATFSLARQNGYHMAYSYAVTSFIVIVSWISFWLPVTAVPARVTLGVTTLLTLVTTANYVRSSLPPISYVTAVDVWVGLCTVFVFASLVLYPVSHYMSEKKATDNYLSMKVESKINPDLRKCTFCGGVKSEQRKLLSKESKQKTNLDDICRKLFPTAFVLVNIVYWSYYIPKSHKT